jgi:hypothetical protein
VIIFGRMEASRAVTSSLDGDQALCVGEPTRDEQRKAPPPFHNAKRWGQLFDQDLGRLVQTAKDLGATPVRLMFRGADEQSVLLCGNPLRRAMNHADT